MRLLAKIFGERPPSVYGADYRRAGWNEAYRLVDKVDVACAERNRYIRAFNRLEKAVTNHLGWHDMEPGKESHDEESLRHAHQAVMRSLVYPREFLGIAVDVAGQRVIIHPDDIEYLYSWGPDHPGYDEMGQ